MKLPQSISISVVIAMLFILEVFFLNYDYFPFLSGFMTFLISLINVLCMYALNRSLKLVK